MAADGGGFGGEFVRNWRSLLRPDEIIVDLFAGGGGMSIAIEHVLGPVAIAINHDAAAVDVFSKNFPHTETYLSGVHEVDPRAATRGRPVGYIHLSPDCTHHSQAQHGQPRDSRRRALSWIALRWIGQLDKKPRYISIENVIQILDWCPLIAKRDKATGRVVTLDEVVCPITGRKTNRIAEKGEVVPLRRQFLVPDPRRIGETWMKFQRALEAFGYTVSYRRLEASQYGAGTSRDRVFIAAKLGDEPHCWPEPSHAERPLPGQQKWVPAAESFDFNIPTLSVFATPREAKVFSIEHSVGVPKRPLKPATLRRIARGLKRYVLDAEDPYIVERRDGVVVKLDAAAIMKVRGSSDGRAAGAPLPTITAGAGAARPAGCAHAMGLITASLTEIRYEAAYIGQANNHRGKEPNAGRSARRPLSSVTTKGCQQNLITASLITLRGDNTGSSVAAPVRAMTAGGTHHAIIEYTLSQTDEEAALRVADFLIEFYDRANLAANRHAMTEQEWRAFRLELVTIRVGEKTLLVTDLSQRMATPGELFKAQGFPSNYVFTHGASGKKYPAHVQNRLVGNSVSPQPAIAFLKAQFTAPINDPHQDALIAA